MADASRDVTSRQIPTAMGRLHVSDHPGDEPALILMHGFPDDSRIYNRLVPLLPPRRAVTFDFLGYGGPERPQAGALDRADHIHVHQLGAVLDELGIETAVLAGYDASGPVAVDYALAAPDRVGQLILLNTYYGHTPALRLPEMIRLLADPDMTPLADAMLNDPDQRMWLLGHTARQFGGDPSTPAASGSPPSCPSSSAMRTTPTRCPRSEPGPPPCSATSTRRTGGSPKDNWPVWTSPSAWSSGPSTATSTPTWLPTSPACSRGPTSTWWTVRPTGPSGTSPRRSRS